MPYLKIVNCVLLNNTGNCQLKTANWVGHNGKC